MKKIVDKKVIEFVNLVGSSIWKKTTTQKQATSFSL